MMNKQLPLIVIPADQPLQIGDSPRLAELRGVAEIRLFRDRPADEEALLRRVADAEVMINSRGHIKWPGRLLEQLPKLRMISTCSIGTDSIDLPAARRLGIVVSNIPGKTRTVVAEHAVALMFGTARRLAWQTAALRAGHWKPQDTVFLAGKTLGIVGTGAIGAEVARLGRALGMHVLAWTFRPSPQRAAELGVTFTELDELLSRSDVVSLHVKLTAESRHLIGRRELALMKSTALLINTARGDVVDTEALVEALHNGRIGGAGLDVYDVEPLPAGHRLLTCEQVVLTPHAADQTPEGMDFLNQGAVDNVLAFLRGQPQNVVNG
jgi:phosphoglycerate dehydrogenase-like enzyme